MTSVPANSATVTHWYKQNVYDSADNKIGEIMDVLVDREGKATALIIGVGGFLGAGEKDVAVPFNAVHATTKDNNKWYLVMNSTKDELKSAKGFKYDRTKMTWMPEDAPATTGAPNAPAPRPRRILKELGFAHVSPRPQHPKQDPQTIEAFKKTFLRASLRR